MEARGAEDPRITLPPPVAVILHYESCRFLRWRDKFSDYAHRLRAEGRSAIKEAVQFTKFYRESIMICTQLLSTQRHQHQQQSIADAMLFELLRETTDAGDASMRADAAGAFPVHALLVANTTEVGWHAAPSACRSARTAWIAQISRLLFPFSFTFHRSQALKLSLKLFEANPKLMIECHTAAGPFLGENTMHVVIVNRHEVGLRAACDRGR